MDDLAVRERDAAAEIPLYPAISDSEEEAITVASEAVLDWFFTLALATTRRTARLCAAPGALAIWALESLKDQAEAALRFGGWWGRGLGAWVGVELCGLVGVVGVVGWGEGLD